MKKPKLVVAALMLLVGAASIAGPKLWAGSVHPGESAMLMQKMTKRGS